MPRLSRRSNPLFLAASCGIPLLARIPLLLGVMAAFACGEPTEVREWRSTNGKTVSGRALSVANGKARLERAGGQVVDVPLTAFVPEDQKFLSEHFGAGGAKPPGEPGGSAAKPASGLPHPLGETTGPIEAGPAAHYFVYLPKSLKEGRKAPLMFCSDASGGSANSIKPFLDLAELGGWIVAVSVESTNGLGYPASLAACEAAVKHLLKTLPIDEARIYFTGNSGGGAQALQNTTVVRAAGVMPWVTYVAAPGRPKAPRYFLIGGAKDLNRYCTGAMANELGRGAVLRFHPGGHTGPQWMLEDGMFWFQGEYLREKRDDHRDEAADFEAAVIPWLRRLAESEPHRAYEHAVYLKQTYRIQAPNAAAIDALVAELSAKPNVVRYLAGLKAVEDFGSKKLAKFENKGKTEVGHSDPSLAKAAKALAATYAGVPVIEEVFRSFAEPTI